MDFELTPLVLSSVFLFVCLFVCLFIYLLFYFYLFIYLFIHFWSQKLRLVSMDLKKRPSYHAMMDNAGLTKPFLKYRWLLYVYTVLLGKGNKITEVC